MIILSILIVLIILVIAIVIYSNTNGNDEEMVEILNDNDYSDNQILYGKWKSKKLEIYSNGELVLEYIDVNDKQITINSDEDISICYNDIDGTTNCTDSKYLYIDNKLYVSNSGYLANESEILFGETSMIIKAALDPTSYSFLYFERE